MNLGVQYYRPPFPVQRFWEDDFKRIAEAGLNTVQLWVLWAWVEPQPGQFRFEDYDCLVEHAEKNSLGVVFSTIAEIQPYWIHREVPGSEMIDNMGHKVVSSNRGECHFGLTPGGCTDNPQVWERMTNFFRETVKRYCKSPAIRGWDAWNELRWNVQADGLVCYCSHTLAAFRKWLDEKYGGLDGLNEAWLRRYGQWDEVWPGKICARPYTEMMAFEHFLTCRANHHGKARYDFIKSIDAKNPILVHGDSPSALYWTDAQNPALVRGNDWNYADGLDGIGCSSFPKWFGLDDADFGIRVECVKSAARNKKVWLSEVQGGRSSLGFNVYPPVDAMSQQRWIWNGLACGADTILFWCWRDEVFGTESGGFGLSGRDGLAEERMTAMRITSDVLKSNSTLLENYQPSAGEVGIFFSPQSYYLCWAQEATAQRTISAIMGYAKSLVRSSINFRIIEEEHLDELTNIKILFMPRTIALPAAAEVALEKFVRNGGTLVCESECGAFNPAGIYSYPEDRFIAKLTGIAELGRRSLCSNTVTVNIDGTSLELTANQWTTPLNAAGCTVLADCPDGPIVVEKNIEKGKVVLCGSYFGNGYMDDRRESFEQFVSTLVSRAGCQHDVTVISPQKTRDTFVYIRCGSSNGHSIVFVFLPKDVHETTLEFRQNFFCGDSVVDIISGRALSLAKSANGKTCTLQNSGIGIAVLAENNSAS